MIADRALLTMNTLVVHSTKYDGSLHYRYPEVCEMFIQCIYPFDGSLYAWRPDGSAQC